MAEAVTGFSANDHCTMLNTSYDVLVGPCNDVSFYYGNKAETDDRYLHTHGSQQSPGRHLDFSCGVVRFVTGP